jgi:hypothetical protein
MHIKYQCPSLTSQTHHFVTHEGMLLPLSQRASSLLLCHMCCDANIHIATVTFTTVMCPPFTMLTRVCTDMCPPSSSMQHCGILSTVVNVLIMHSLCTMCPYILGFHMSNMLLTLKYGTDYTSMCSTLCCTVGVQYIMLRCGVTVHYASLWSDITHSPYIALC